MSMRFVPHFRVTPKIKKMVAEIEARKCSCKKTSRSEEKKYFEKIEKMSSDSHEVGDYMRAYDKVIAWAKGNRPITEPLIKELHAAILGKNRASSYRRGQNAIYDPTKTDILYLPPPHRYLPSLMKELVAWIESSQYPPPITAAVCHIGINTIHPYYDGNGRLARLLTKLILMKAGYPMTLIEKFYYNDLDRYYEALNLADSLTSWISYFCEGILYSYRKK